MLTLLYRTISSLQNNKLVSIKIFQSIIDKLYDNYIILFIISCDKTKTGKMLFCLGKYFKLYTRNNVIWTE